jgi:ADP-ribose pyrophosphatase YjhB (NUDIX family)
VNFSFCPVCGGPFRAVVLKAGEPERFVCQACGFVYYVDPKVAVGTIIRVPGAEGIVLARRAIEPGRGKWVFPGGYVDRGEVVEHAAIREAREEVGLDVRLDGLVGIYSYAGRTPIVIVYTAQAVAGEMAIDDESLEARLFARADVPWSDLAFASTDEALRAYFDGRVWAGATFGK